jgi:putative ABC transport system ATP-binding protein
MKDLLIHTNNVSLEFTSGDQTTVAVKNASISIPAGVFTIIYGASGSGKSSLLNVISGLQAPSKGQLYFNNMNLYEKTANELAYFRAEQLGIVYQTNYWVKSLSVIENVSMPLYFLGYSKSTANELALKALNKVNMQSYAKKYPSLLSGGEQQRVAMARAIVSDPPVIIADEPTGNLDSTNGDMVMNLLKTLNKEQGKTIVLVTHNMEYLSIAQAFT